MHHLSAPFSRLLIAAVVTTGLTLSATAATAPQLLLSDDFNRTEATPGKEDIGNGWTSNSERRAKSNQQVFLKDGSIHITKHSSADHGVAVFHDVAFQNGTVSLRFQLTEGDDLGVDFVDRELKTVHAGHLCIARVTLKTLTLTDSKTGAMDLKIQERKLAGDKSKELADLLKSKSKTFNINLSPSTWHTLEVTVIGDTMSAQIDGQSIGEFSSEGIAHPTKRMITLAVNKSADVDDLKVYSLAP